MRLYELRQKQVINIHSCRVLGYINDLIIDTRTGCIESMIVPTPGKICLFPGKEYDLCIPWKCIVQIGKDIILVDVDEDLLMRKTP